MSSVTYRIKEIKQPRGGYLPPKLFEHIQFQDNNLLAEENLHPSTVGMVVDYLSRIAFGVPKEEAFAISLAGAKKASRHWGEGNDLQYAKTLLNKINGVDTDSVISACKLTAFDIWYRQPGGRAYISVKPSEIFPNDATVYNIQSMVQRSMDFYKKFGPIIADGFTFAPHGYTQTVDSGDGDFMTKDTMWDFKVSKAEPKNDHTLQLLMYWIMGQHSGQEIYKGIDKIGIFNPRLNTAYILKIADIPPELIATIEQEVICY